MDTPRPTHDSDDATGKGSGSSLGGLTYEQAIDLAAEITDPDFLERYWAMKQRLAELEARIAAL